MATTERRPLRKRLHRDAQALGGLLLLYLALSYLLAPAWWRHHNREEDEAGLPGVTHTASGIPGDPLNVALVGTEEEVVRALDASGWLPADPTTLRTSLRIAARVALRRPYPQAPMSNLYLWGRRQDLAFEKPAGNSPSRRHHVRFWKAPGAPGKEGRPLWMGAATFDRSVGLSHLTGQVTHHIGADVDRERDDLLADLERAGQLTRRYRIPSLAPREGRNGGGDRYFTDGWVIVGVLAPAGAHRSSRQ